MLKKGIKEYLESLDLKETLLYLVACKLEIDCNIADDLFTKLIKNNIIERDYVNEKIIVKIPIFEGDTDSRIIVNEDLLKNINIIENRIDEYRSKFKGIRTKSIGDKKQCIQNLMRWMIQYSHYNFDDILEATDYYIANTDPQYISNADNFIFNYDNKGNLVSGLSIIMDTIRMGTIEKKIK